MPCPFPLLCARRVSCPTTRPWQPSPTHWWLSASTRLASSVCVTAGCLRPLCPYSPAASTCAPWGGTRHPSWAQVRATRGCSLGCWLSCGGGFVGWGCRQDPYTSSCLGWAGMPPGDCYCLVMPGVLSPLADPKLRFCPGRPCQVQPAHLPPAIPPWPDPAARLCPALHPALAPCPSLLHLAPVLSCRPGGAVPLCACPAPRGHGRSHHHLHSHLCAGRRPEGGGERTGAGAWGEA